jgi:hypothetical protein
MGTGTFFRLENQLWLVTAAHVIETERDLKELAVPMKSAEKFLTLGNCTLYRPNNLNLDVAIVQIQDKDFEEHLSQSWRVLDESNITRFDSNVSMYVIAGYPRETLQKTRMNWRESFTRIYANPFPGGARDADRPMFRLVYAKTVENTKGSVSDTPHLGGISGASVWALTNRNHDLWAVDKICKVVAVQVSFKHSEYISAEWWTLVREVIKRWSESETSKSL